MSKATSDSDIKKSLESGFILTENNGKFH
jgi:hypothetical protein